MYVCIAKAFFRGVELFMLIDEMEVWGSIGE